MKSPVGRPGAHDAAFVFRRVARARVAPASTAVSRVASAADSVLGSTASVAAASVAASAAAAGAALAPTLFWRRVTSAGMEPDWTMRLLASAEEASCQRMEARGVSKSGSEGC